MVTWRLMRSRSHFAPDVARQDLQACPRIISENKVQIRQNQFSFYGNFFSRKCRFEMQLFAVQMPIDEATPLLPRAQRRLLPKVAMIERTDCDAFSARCAQRRDGIAFDKPCRRATAFGSLDGGERRLSDLAKTAGAREAKALMEKPLRFKNATTSGAIQRGDFSQPESDEHKTARSSLMRSCRFSVPSAVEYSM
jgi:hypothetical protein